MIVAYGGERTLDWSTVADIEGRLLQDLSRDAEAEAKLERSCDVAAFVLPASSTGIASCLMDLAQSRRSRGKHREALELVSRALAIDVARLGPDHTDVGELYQVRGNIEYALGDRAATIADFERACAILERALAGPKSVGPGSLGAAEWALGQVVWKDDHARGRDLISRAIGHLTGQARFAAELADATAWMKRWGER